MSFGSRKRAVLIDGSWLVFRAFFAIPPNFTTQDGLHTNATYGFATMFKKLFAGKRPELGAVFFDCKEATLREKQFPEYKAQRPSIPGELREQLEWIDKVVLAHGFPIIRRPGFEADDLIATTARMLVENDYDVMIVAGDKDLAQVVSERVRMHDTMKDVVYTPDLVKKKWGVAPEQIADYLALVGDTVDNIPGLPGVGAKTASELLTQYGNLDVALENLAQLKPKLRQIVESHRSELATYRELTRVNERLDQSYDVSLGVETLSLGDESDAEVRELFLRLQFHSLLSDDAKTATLSVVDVSPLASYAQFRERHVDAKSFVVQPIWGLRDGTTAASADLPSISRRQLVFGAWILRVDDVLYAIEAMHLREFWQAWREDLSGKKVWLYDNKSLLLAALNLGWLAAEHAHTFWGEADVGDVMVQSFLCEPTKIIPHRLSQIAKEYLQEGGAFLDLPTASNDAAHAAKLIAQLGQATQTKMESFALAAHYTDVELPLTYVLAKMEHRGVAANKESLLALETEFSAARADVETQIFALAGKTFNLNSPKQLGAVLFDDLKLPVVKKTKTGYSTDAEVLERLSSKHEIAALIVRHRELSKLIQTYTRVLAVAVQDDGRIHMSVQQTVGASGRLITAEPDLQRTPVRTLEGKRIREAFSVPPERVMLVLDWSQIELRVLAHLSRDPELLRAFSEGRDLHRQTGSILFEKDQKEITKGEREIAKTVNFATIYGQGATSLAQILSIARKDAETYIRNYFEHYQGVAKFLADTIAHAKENGYVQTLTGRRRFIPELASRSPMDEKAGERIACNTPIQGSAADLCKIAMVAIDRALLPFGDDAKMVLQVHDELIFDVRKECADEVRALVLGYMEAPIADFAVPLVAECGVAASWGLAKS